MHPRIRELLPRRNKILISQVARGQKHKRHTPNYTCFQRPDRNNSRVDAQKQGRWTQNEKRNVASYRYPTRRKDIKSAGHTKHIQEVNSERVARIKRNRKLCRERRRQSLVRVSKSGHEPQRWWGVDHCCYTCCGRTGVVYSESTEILANKKISRLARSPPSTPGEIGPKNKKEKKKWPPKRYDIAQTRDGKNILTGQPPPPPHHPSKKQTPLHKKKNTSKYTYKLYGMKNTTSIVQGMKKRKKMGFACGRR